MSARPVSAPVRRRSHSRKGNHINGGGQGAAAGGAAASGGGSSHVGPLKELLCDQKDALRDADRAFEYYKTAIKSNTYQQYCESPRQQHHPRPPSRGRQSRMDCGWNALEPIDEVSRRKAKAPAGGRDDGRAVDGTALVQEILQGMKTVISEILEPIQTTITQRIDEMECSRNTFGVSDSSFHGGEAIRRAVQDAVIPLVETVELRFASLEQQQQDLLKMVTEHGMNDGDDCHDVTRVTTYSDLSVSGACTPSGVPDDLDVQVSLKTPRLRPMPSLRSAMRRGSSVATVGVAGVGVALEQQTNHSFQDIVTEILHEKPFAGASQSRYTPRKDKSKSKWDILRSGLTKDLSPAADTAGLLDAIYELNYNTESTESFMRVLMCRLLEISAAGSIMIQLGKRMKDFKGISRLVVQDKFPVQIHLTSEQLMAHPLYVAEIDDLLCGKAPAFVSLLPIILDEGCVGVAMLANRNPTVDHLGGFHISFDPREPHRFRASRVPNDEEAPAPNSYLPFLPDPLKLANMVLMLAAPLIKSTFVKEKTMADCSLLAQIVEIVNMMGRIEDLPSLIQHAAGGAKRLVDSESCVFYLLSESDPTKFVRNGIAKVSQEHTCGLLMDVVKTKEGIQVELGHGEVHQKLNLQYANHLGVGEIRNILLCPISCENKMYGVIEVVNKADGEFTRLDSMLVESLGNYAAVSIQHNNTIKLLNNTSKKASAMLDVCKDLAAVTLDPEALHSSVMEHARQIVNADRASLFICDWQRKCLVATFGNQIVTMPINKGIAGTVATTGENLNILDAYSDNRFNQSIDKKSGYRTKTLLAVPVKCDGQVVAVAQLINKKAPAGGSPLPFDAEDEDLLESFSTFAGISLRISAQYKDLSKERHKFKTMLDAVVGVADTDIREGVNTLCRTIMHQAKQLILADRCSLFMLDKENSQLYSCVTDQQGGEIRFGMHQGIAGQTVRLGVTLNIPDAYKDQHFNTENDRQRGYHTKTILAAPIKFEGDAIAVMQLINKAGDIPFDEEDEETLNFFATLAGITIRNSQLYEFATKGSEEIASVLLKLNNPGQKSTKEEGPLASEREQDLMERVLAVEKTLSRRELDSACLPTFDIHVYRSKPDGLESAIRIVHEMFELRGLIDLFCIDREVLYRFLIRVALGYRNVPYHSVYHAIDVTQTLFQYMYVLPQGTFTKLEEFVLLICGICHDVDHMGLNNSFHYKAETPLGILSSATGGSSPLEIHHCNYAIEILQKGEYNIFANFPNQADEVQAYKLMVKCILGTDMAHHGKLFKEMQELQPHDIATGQKETCLTVLLKAADISNVTKPFEISRMWAYYVLDEFYMQGDQEARTMGEISNEMFDRNNKKEVAEGQLGFMGFVKPFYTQVARVFPELQFLVHQLEENERSWRGVQERQDKERLDISLMQSQIRNAPPRLSTSASGRLANQGKR